MKTSLTAKVTLQAPIDRIWALWTDPGHIAKWNTISETWHTPRAENDFRVGGELFLRMETLDGKEGFDYRCTYNDISYPSKIGHTNTDGRKTVTLFVQTGDGVTIEETFEPEKHTPLEIQQQFCLSVLQNFKTYVTENL
ncbi:MAG: SRPBCC domain-containing protein [Sediminicola sp.]|tara:strand:- start:54586 stop:55002 length:417 start_codon:yes stop_codon:yes gene_type:complete